MDGGVEMSNIDTLIAYDSIPATEFLDVCRYESITYLYDKLRRLGLENISEEFVNFYNLTANSSHGILSDIAEQIPEINSLETEFYNTSFKSIDSLFIVYSDSLGSIRNLIEIETDSSNLAQLEILSGVVTDYINNLDLTRDSLTHLTELVADGKLLPLLARNALISTVEVQEDNERAVNEIYLNTIVNDRNLQQDQIDILWDISNKCPLIAGTAVYRARAILSLALDSLSFDDDSNCVAAGIAPRLGKPQTNENKTYIPFELYPNPAYNQFTISGEIDQMGVVEIYNSYGKKIKSIDLIKGRNNINMDLSDQSAGIIYFRIISNLNVIQKGKIIIMK